MTYRLILMRSLGIFLASLSLSAQNSGNYFNDSTSARYRYDLESHQYATIPGGTSINDLDPLEKELLKPLWDIQKISSGINSSNEPYYEIQNVRNSSIENWLSKPYRQLLTPAGSYGFDSLGNEVYYFPNNPIENLDMQDQVNQIQSDGFQPIMMFFPTKRDDFVQEALDQGATMLNHEDNAFTLILGESEVRIEPETKTIQNRYRIENTQYEVTTAYTLLSPYGYVPIWEKESRQRLDLDHPISLINQRTFRNHVIEDLYDKIEKYTDKAYLQVYPNPVVSEFEIILRGLPEAQVSLIQIRDHFGNILFSYSNPSVDQNIIHLDGSTYPSGVLILLVYTQEGIFTETLTKI
ncbi:T9SS type A sorting domain-containing protein [Croceimicrobium hydrocarbonivorans]|uniref:T9SS type A sorting domain-containing protein n=1 Tax=Croceimicrobium hydrocarbonivorans TaxID=2761580 RepID=A0A7H0VGX6_9FLAO|nr:T9SS type A sorting domain-containing protein [Croceimicrobium hydrocarbonivorans]QNR24974.1 T9SS type A sorting domain-containing protein [Croceimicrobium hydrocarbonivorans]